MRSQNELTPKRSLRSARKTKIFSLTLSQLRRRLRFVWKERCSTAAAACISVPAATSRAPVGAARVPDPAPSCALPAATLCPSLSAVLPALTPPPSPSARPPSSPPPSRFPTQSAAAPSKPLSFTPACATSDSHPGVRFTRGWLSTSRKLGRAEGSLDTVEARRPHSSNEKCARSGERSNGSLMMVRMRPITPSPPLPLASWPLAWPLAAGDCFRSAVHGGCSAIV